MGGQTATKASTNTSAEGTGQRSQPHASQYVPSGPHADVLALQRSAGNRAVTQVLEAEGGNRPPTGNVHHTMAGSECSECSKKKRLGLQTKLKVNEPGDIYEQEADRIADQVMATPAHPAVSGAPPRIQRFSGQSNGQMDAAPASVDQALASPGRPLEPALRQDMEQRFGHDFSRVRVHSGAAAEQSARDVNAHAYTVGHDMVFGAGQFAPGTQEGRCLIAHELTHVVQQGTGHVSPQTLSKGLVVARAPIESGKKIGARNKPGFGTGKRTTEKPHDELTEKILAWAEKKEANEKLEKEILVPFIHQRGIQILDQWLIQVVSANSLASVPVEEGRDHWFIALLGNLVWAASCFVPGAGIIKAGAAIEREQSRSSSSPPKVAAATAAGVGEVAQAGMTSLGKKMYVTMATGGAFVGSGGIQRLAPGPSGAPSGKDLVAEALNKKRKQLGDELKKSVEPWASEVVHGEKFGADDYNRGPEKYLQAVDRTLWVNLLPSIPFEGYNEIFNGALQAINFALADFNRQYRQWQDIAQRYAGNEARGRYGLNWVTYQDRLNYWQSQFKPKLSFGESGESF